MARTAKTRIHDARLDAYFPFRGPCAFCGHADARHRLWDVICQSPDSDADVVYWYEVPLEAVRLVREVRPYQLAHRTAAARRHRPGEGVMP